MKGTGNTRSRRWRATVADEQMTVAEHLDGWLAGKQALRPSTRQAYGIHISKYLTPHLGGLPLARLRPAHIERMYREITGADDGGRPLSHASLRRIHATLTSALNTAVRRGLIERNPAATVELPPVHRPKVCSWSAAELGRFLELSKDDRLHLLYLLLGLVGLRRGEAVALRWSDLDLNQGLLRVEQSAVKVAGRSVVGPPKSASGARTVALDEETCRRLQWQQARQRLEILRATGAITTPELVFTTPVGEPLDPTYVSRHFDRLIARHDLPRIRLHDLWHTSASIGLASGESLLEVKRFSQLVGSSGFDGSVSTTFDTAERHCCWPPAPTSPWCRRSSATPRSHSPSTRTHICWRASAGRPRTPRTA